MRLTEEISKKINIRDTKSNHKQMLQVGHKNKLFAMLKEKYPDGILETETAERKITKLNIVQYVKMLEDEIEKSKRN